MNVKMLDLVTTKYLSKKLLTEMELEILANNPPANLSMEEVSEKIMEKVSTIRNISSDIQTWEGFVNQITKTPEGENNK